MWMIRQPSLSCALLLVAAATAGCGGGASLKPSVTYRPSHPPAAGSEVADTATPAEATPSTVAAPTAETGGFGTIRGRVVVQGDFPRLPPLYEKNAAPKDPTICGFESAPNESVIVNDGGLANVFVFLAKVPKGVEIPPPTGDIEFDQRHCVFQPHVLVVQTGQKIKVLNDDAVAHNTHTYPKRNSPFNQTVAPNDRSGVSLTYGRPETLPFQVGCDIHPWMVAYHLPVDHPWAAVTAADGTFEIKNLPSGKQEFKVWHEKGGELERALSVLVKPNETVEIEIPVASTKLSQFAGPAAPVVQLSLNR